MSRRQVFQEYTFKLGCTPIKGSINEVPGMDLYMFMPEGGGSPLFLGFVPKQDEIGVPITLYKRHGSNKVMRCITEDDFVENGLSNDTIDLTVGLYYLSNILSERRLQYYPVIVRCIGFCIVSALAMLLSIIWVRPIWISLVPAFVLSLNIMIAVKYSGYARETRVYDCKGNWVDLSSGRTNLAGGYKVPVGR